VGLGRSIDAEGAQAGNSRAPSFCTAICTGFMLEDVQPDFGLAAEPQQVVGVTIVGVLSLV
jgi:hypothetical protein